MWVLLQTTSAPVAPALSGGYGAALLQALLALVAVSVLAWVVLRGLARGSLLRGSGRRVRVLERTPLDTKHALLLVEVDGETLLLGVGDGSAPALIRKLAGGRVTDAEGAAGAEEAAPASTGTGGSPGASGHTASASARAASASPPVASSRQAFSAALARVRLARAADSKRDEKNSVS